MLIHHVVEKLPLDDSSGGSSNFGDIAYAYVHDTQNSQASLIADNDAEWIIEILQACTWQMYMSRLEVQRYVMSFFDRSNQLVASGQLVESGLYLSAGEGILVCDVTAQTANRIRQMQ